MTHEKAKSDYERARRRLHAALDEVKADGIDPAMSFTALIDLLVDWSLQMDGKQTLWDVVGLMQSRVDERGQLAREMPEQRVN
jgi:hypothetical protein